MKLPCFRRCAWVAAVLCLVLPFPLFAAQNKLIRLRNQTIPPRFAKTLEPSFEKQANGKLSGLYLIQFSTPPGAEARVQLAAAGVQLLHYVPDDTFLARAQNASLAELRALPWVAWVGQYRPEHKVHRSLAAPAKTGVQSASLDVTVLIAPGTSAGEVSSVSGLLGSVKQKSTLRAGTVLRGTISAGQLNQLAQSEAVIWIEPSHPMKMVDEVSSKIVAGDGGGNELLAQSLGFDGRGVKVAVADSGLNNGDADTMHPDLLGRTPAFFYYGQLTDAADEHSHGTHVSGIIAGNGATGEVDANGALYGLGVAPGASIIAQRIFDGVGNYEAPPSYEKLTRDAVRAGAVIGSNSWGDDTQGAYDVSAMEFDALVRDADALTLGDQQYILEFSAGNAGPGAQTIGSPAVAKNVIATGASENDRLDLFIYGDGIDAMADFSSRGPCEDGRIKPDVVAPGTWIASLQSESATDENAWSPIDQYYQYQGGTSQAGPHASGVAAVFVQFYRSTHTNATPSPALVKAALINSAVDMFDEFGTGPIPNMDEGWGRIDLTSFFDSALTFDYVDQSVPLTNGQVYERHFTIGSPDEALKVTLTYTDVPGFPGAVAALVNDLDLEVIAPDGVIYHGNQFNGGESIPGAPATDTINNVEGVHLATPVPGQYIVRVRARKVVEDARDDTPAVDQDFALAISGEVLAAGTGAVFLDRQAYTAPGTMKITVVDSDLAGQATVTVQARSSYEPNNEPVLLHSFDPSGVFTGAVATALGPPQVDGKLQVTNDATLTVDYFDASANRSRTAIAAADLLPPVITLVATTNEFGQTVVTWTTSEPSTTSVRYGTNTSLNQFITDSALVTDHSIALPGLVVGRTYLFAAISADQAGNFGTNNNGGADFSFTAPRPNTVLVVDAFVHNDFDNDIPLSVYTDPLTQLGISYDVWNTATVGRSPSTNNLRPYRVVIWRFNDGIGSTDTLSGTDQSSIRAYLNAGGSFFMASMEQLTRLGPGFFRNQILHVTDFSEDVGVPGVLGQDGDYITAGMDMGFDFSQYNNQWHDLLGVPDDISDTMVISRDASPILFDSTVGEVAGVKYPRTGQDSTGRVVYLSFPLDAAPVTGTAPNNRTTLLQNILSFLVPGLNGRGTISLDSSAYNIPSFAKVEVADADLAGRGAMTVAFASTTQASPVTVTLTEVQPPGLFRGSVQIIAATNPPTAGALRAKAGDSVWVDYLDASAGTTLRATATVDTTGPQITAVVSEPDYQEAIISWTTSEAADSTVQFGESILLGRSASDSTFSTLHEIALRGLIPDKTYYFQVSSSDIAGNTATDDNQGRMYSFRTLKPLLPPWTDNMNSGGADWTTYDADTSQSSWTLGVPSNGVATSAHSPPNAWGSDLTGIPLDYTESYLISPAIYLTNGNTATLTFWHAYDFTSRSENDIIEGGQLLIITNAATAPITLTDYGDASGGWVQEHVDLTPYMGQVVYFAWYYLLFSFDTLPRDGWLLDDVSVTVTTVAPGTIEITNSISQAKYVLSGLIYQNGKGTGMRITNAPPGSYTVEYADVPYYNTPASQMKTLASGQTISFVGNYTITDVNGNGMADAWETQYFGSVSPNRTRTTDTDGDGMPDYAEFIAGTNPTNAASSFRLGAQRLTSGSLTLNWAASVGRSYQVLSSSNATSWAPLTSWMLATSSSMSYTLPTSPGAPKFYKLAVQP